MGKSRSSDTSTEALTTATLQPLTEVLPSANGGPLQAGGLTLLVSVATAHYTVAGTWPGLNKSLLIH